ncbi:MAG: two-component sensor histidine kinase [Micrococcales bacterium]|nr:two-component sensor histidine kinase [Micrococcales bacterium]
MITQLPGSLIVLDGNDRVQWAAEQILTDRLVRRDRIAVRSVLDCAMAARASGETTVTSVSILRPPLRTGDWDLRVRAIPLDFDWVLLVIDDLSEENRVAAVRRDFIANVSHELKTPVGAVALLSEALVAARDDPKAVSHFAEKMQIETERLSNLIQDVIDLGRLQGEDPLENARVVPLPEIADSAVEFVRGAADAKNITLALSAAPDSDVFGERDQIETAMRNVLANAIAYSSPHTQVAISVRPNGAIVEITVRDQGIGIPETELDRIFERFYRVDAARSRVTGGTGLGLSIVRNVCRNHGGDVQVWSAPGEGSTFTLQLPRYQKSSQDNSSSIEEKP